MAWTKKMPDNPVVAVCGATGVVGREFLKVLEDRNFPASKFIALASSRSEGKKLPFMDGEIEVHEMTPESFKGVDIALFSAGASISKKFRQAVVDAGAVMIDNSSAFRMEEGVPLVVPEVNAEEAFKHEGVIANPNCSTIEMVVALKPLYDISKIKRVVVSTYQAASGAGVKAMDELYAQTRQFLDGEELTISAFTDQIAFNTIPHIDVFLDDDYTKEEWKMVVETKKIFGDPNIAVAPTCVRVPVLRCHAESVNVEFEDEVTVDAARSALEAGAGVTVMDNPAESLYPMPGLLAGTDDVYVGRLRKDPTVEHGLAMWLVMDQIRKGAALNAVQIAEALVEGR
ncbi:MAG: aspartate-semialdehyde dehydrogenase [Coriobacteriales bacterium]|jgi:aspartate-semialdehyde dehydrogenase